MGGRAQSRGCAHVVPLDASTNMFLCTPRSHQHQAEHLQPHLPDPGDSQEPGWMKHLGQILQDRALLWSCQRALCCKLPSLPGGVQHKQVLHP